MTTKTNKNLKKFVALGLGLSLLASIGIGAYLTDTDTKSDVYTVGNVQAEIIANGDMEVANAGYLLPGTTHVYERAASNVGINDAYIFMSVTIPYETIGVADDNGTQLGEKVMQLFTPGTINSEWKLVDDGFIGEYAITANGQAAGEHDTHSVIAGDTITYVYGYVGDNADGALKALASGETTSNLLEELKLTNLYNASKIDGEVSTKLYAIQSNHVNGGLTDVNGVWAVINKALVADTAVQAPVFDEADVYFSRANADEYGGTKIMSDNTDSVVMTVYSIGNREIYEMKYGPLEFECESLLINGDKAEFTFEVANDSEFDVMVNFELQDYNFEYYQVSISNSELTLGAGETATINVTIELMKTMAEDMQASIVLNMTEYPID